MDWSRKEKARGHRLLRKICIWLRQHDKRSAHVNQIIRFYQKIVMAKTKEITSAYVRRLMSEYGCHHDLECLCFQKYLYQPQDKTIKTAFQRNEHGNILLKKSSYFPFKKICICIIMLSILMQHAIVA